MRLRTKVCELQEEVCRIHKGLPVAGLVTSTGGSASGIECASGLVVIKPSGIGYDDLTPAACGVVEVETGRHNSGGKPSEDTPHHLLVSQRDERLRGIIRRDSDYVMAFVAVERSIPCAFTGIAGEFGGEIPCALYNDNSGDQIATAILKHSGRGTRILLGRHDVFWV